MLSDVQFKHENTTKITRLSSYFTILYKLNPQHKFTISCRNFRNLYLFLLFLLTTYPYSPSPTFSISRRRNAAAPSPWKTPLFRHASASLQRGLDRVRCARFNCRPPAPLACFRVCADVRCLAG